MKKFHVQKWIDAHRKWKDGTAHAAGRCAMAMCNWAAKSDEPKFAGINSSPLKGFEKAKATARDCDLTDDEWKRLAATNDDDFRDAIKFMRLTGCRPDEMRRAEKRHFDPSVSAIIFPPSEWKNGKKTKKERVIQLVGEALVIVQKRCLKHPSGPIFRNRKGTPWKKDSLARKFARLRVKLGIPKLIPYSLRHTYATASAFKVDSLILAELMGTSIKMLESVYAKARKRQGLMAQAAARAIEGIA